MNAGRLRLLLMLALFASPMIAAWLSYLYWQPGRHTNYGRLLPPQPLVLPAVLDEAGHARPWQALRGKWVLIVAAPGGCDSACADNGRLARQVWLAQGRERQRVERLFLGPARPDGWPPGAGAYHAALAELPGTLAGGGLFLVDPLGNLMMAFPARAQGKRVIEDLSRLLKISSEG